MLHSISWKLYLETMITLIIMYYAVIVTVFFRKECLALLKGKLPLKSPGKPGGDPSVFYEAGIAEDMVELRSGLADSSDIAENKAPTLFPIAYQLVDELKVLITHGMQKKYIRQEWVSAFQLILIKEPYPFLKETAFKQAINNFVDTELKEKCGLELSVEELNMMWPN